MFLWAANVQAQTIYEWWKDTTLYGNLDQHDVPVIGPQACGPTSAVNSFVYLQNAYPGIYGNSLVPAVGTTDVNADGATDFYDAMIETATVLGSAGYMNTGAATGTLWDNLLYGKHKYMEEKAPGMTIYEARVNDYFGWSWSNPPVAEPGWVTYGNGEPAWEFLLAELEACEDLEIFLSLPDFGHYVTLTGFHFDDQDDDGIIHWTDVNADGSFTLADTSEAWLQFMDPWTGALGTANIHDDWDGGPIFTSGLGTGWVMMAASESPIPEPATIVLLGSGLLGLGFRFRKKKPA